MAQHDNPDIGIFCCDKCDESFTNLTQAINHIHTQSRTFTKNSSGSGNGGTVNSDTRVRVEARTVNQPQASQFSDHVDYYGLKVLIPRTGETGLKDDTTSAVRSSTVGDEDTAMCQNKGNSLLTEQRMCSVETATLMSQNMSAAFEEKPPVQSEEKADRSFSLHANECLEVNERSLLQTWTVENPVGMTMQPTEKPVGLYPGLKDMENLQGIAETSSPSQNTTCYFDAYTMKEIDTQLLGLFSFGSDEACDDDTSPGTTQIHEWSDDLMNETTNIHTRCDPCEQAKDKASDIIHNHDYAWSDDMMNETSSIHKNCELHEQTKVETSHVLPNFCQHDQLSDDQLIENGSKNSYRQFDNLMNETPHIDRLSGQGNEQLDSLLHKLTNSGHGDEWFRPNLIPPTCTPIGTNFTESCQSNDVMEDIKDPDMVKPQSGSICTEKCEADYVTLDTKTLDLVHIGTILPHNGESNEGGKVISNAQKTKQSGKTGSNNRIYHFKGQVKSSGLKMLTLFTCRHCGRRFNDLGDATTHWQTSCAKIFEITANTKPYTMRETEQSPDISSISGQVETVVLNGQECSTEMVNTASEFDTLSAEVFYATTVMKNRHHGKLFTDLCKGVKGEKPHMCNTCGKVLSSSGALKEHTMIHTGEPKRHECSVCHRRFSRPSFLNHHMESHIESYKCSQCKSGFATLPLLHEHEMKGHKHQKSYKCSDRTKVLSSSSSLRRHMSLHNAGLGELDRAVHTDKVSKYNPPSMKQNSPHKPIKGQKLHKCDTCGKSLSSSSALREHTMIHTGEPKRHECPVCLKRVARPSNLKNHLMRHHKGWTPFKCSQCKDLFVTLPLLEKHLVTTHAESESVECPECNKILSHRDLFPFHMAAHDREIAEEGPSRNEPVRIETHNNERPYPFYHTSQPVDEAAHNTVKHGLGCDTNEPDHVVQHNTEIPNLDSDTFQVVGVEACNTERPSQDVKVYNTVTPNQSADAIELESVEAYNREIPNTGCQTNEPVSVKVHCSEIPNLDRNTSQPPDQEVHNMQIPNPYSDTSESVAGEVLSFDRPNLGFDTSYDEGEEACFTVTPNPGFDSSEPSHFEVHSVETLNLYSDIIASVAREALNTEPDSTTGDPEGVNAYDIETVNCLSDTSKPLVGEALNTKPNSNTGDGDHGCVNEYNIQAVNLHSYISEPVVDEVFNTKPDCNTSVPEGVRMHRTEQPNLGSNTSYSEGIKSHNDGSSTLDCHTIEASDTITTDRDSHTRQPQGVKAQNTDKQNMPLYIRQPVLMEACKTERTKQSYQKCQTAGFNEGSTKRPGPHSHTNNPAVYMEARNPKRPKVGCNTGVAVSILKGITVRPKQDSSYKREAGGVKAYIVNRPNLYFPTSQPGVKAIVNHTSETATLGHHTTEPVGVEVQNNRERSNLGADTNEPVGLQVEQATENKPPPLKDKSSQKNVKGKKLYECSTCGKYLSSYSTLNEYLMIHTGEQKHHECIVCNARFRRPSDVKMHVEKRHTAEDLVKYENERRHCQTHMATYKCSICQKGFRKIKYLDKHIKTHEAFGNSHKCPVCDKLFATPWDLVKHLKTHPEIGAVKCCYCSKKYQSVQLLVLHMQHHKRLVPKSQTCYICNKHFMQKSDLQKHLFSVTQKRTWSCSICGDKFAYASILKLHMRIHRGITPNFCATCDEWFSMAEGLNGHTCCAEQNKYKCCHCELKFTHLYDFMQHVSNIQPGMELFVCMTCWKLLCTKEDLNSHMKWCHQKV